jgi:integrase
VIYGIKPGGRLIDLQPLWQRLRARADIKDACIHDLRRTFASTPVAAGQGLPMIAKLLGHTQVATTARYAQSRCRSSEGGGGSRVVGDRQVDLQ